MRMLLTFLMMTLSLTGFSSLAQEAPASETLKHHMKEIGELFKGIGSRIKDPSQNAANAEASAQISALFKITQAQWPEHLHSLPESHRAEAFQKYQEMIQQCIDIATRLEQAFLHNDDGAAQEIYREMKDLKELGHEEFDP